MSNTPSESSSSLLWVNRCTTDWVGKRFSGDLYLVDAVDKLETDYKIGVVNDPGTQWAEFFPRTDYSMDLEDVVKVAEYMRSGKADVITGSKKIKKEG